MVKLAYIVGYVLEYKYFTSVMVLIFSMSHVITIGIISIIIQYGRGTQGQIIISMFIFISYIQIFIFSLVTYHQESKMSQQSVKLLYLVISAVEGGCLVAFLVASYFILRTKWLSPTPNVSPVSAHPRSFSQGVQL